jgi:CheY-like chemotaxis protein
VLDPYFSTKQRGSQKGMGLGLATVYSIVTAHQGHLEVVSDVGRGTTFHLYLPAAPEVQAPVVVTHRQAAGTKGRILLMDDEKMIRDMAHAMLSSLGYEVDLAEDGSEAIEKYRRARKSARPYHVVILDLTVRAGMGGAEAILKLRAIDPEVKAIVSSGHTADPLVTNHAHHGFQGAVLKPYQVRDMIEVLDRVMR